MYGRYVPSKGFRSTRCSAPDALVKDGLLMIKEPQMKVAFKQLQAVLEFIYLMACFLLEVAAS